MQEPTPAVTVGLASSHQYLKQQQSLHVRRVRQIPALFWEVHPQLAAHATQARRGLMGARARNAWQESSKRQLAASCALNVVRENFRHPWVRLMKPHVLGALQARIQALLELQTDLHASHVMLECFRQWQASPRAPASVTVHQAFPGYPRLALPVKMERIKILQVPMFDTSPCSLSFSHFHILCNRSRTSTVVEQGYIEEW